jgi:hypothetical protein
LESLKRRDHVKHLDKNGTVILKWILNRVGGSELGSSGSSSGLVNTVMNIPVK